MNLTFSLSLTLVICTVAAAVVTVKRPYKAGQFATPSRIFLAGFFLSALILHIPAYLSVYAGEALSSLRSLLLSVLGTLKLFLLDGEVEFLLEFADSLSPGLSAAYSLLAVVLAVAGPILTFSVVLSFFKNVSAYRKLFFYKGPEIFLFSELNAQALALAASLKANHPRCLLVFTDVFESDEEEDWDLRERAREIGALTFKCDISKLDLDRKKASSRISFFVISNNEDENVRQALSLSNRYGHEKHMRLYLFATNVESELLFQSADENGMKVHRVNTIRSLITQTLYDKGISIFRHAVPAEDGTKDISAVIVGLGGHGTEMLKALAWCCQMDGYRIRIDAFDASPDAESSFIAQCPELMAPERNGVRQKGEAEYLINIHSGIDVNSAGFEEHLKNIPGISYVFVSLGNDSRNIQTAVRLREFCARNNHAPYIQAIVYDSHKTRYLKDITNYKKVPYDVDFIGDLDACYSEAVILGSELEDQALARHSYYGDSEDTFWRYEYNYSSSVASALHQHLRKKCGLPGADQPRNERSAEDHYALCVLEHKRWNAYMRTEGYRYSGSIEKASRNDMAKLHNCLVPFDLLPESEKIKDDV